MAPPFGMKDFARQTRSRLIELFAQQGRQPRHDLGQNFLVDLNLHELIVKHARLRDSDVVLEIGTGTGGLTMHMVPHAGHVVSVEFDEHVYGHAQALLGNQPQLTLIHGDALSGKHTLNPAVFAALNAALSRIAETQPGGSERPAAMRAATEDQLNAELSEQAGFDSDDEAENPWQLQSRAPAIKLVANLPYNIATPVMSNLIASDLPWSRMVVTIQLELAERMLAKPGTSDYSALTVWMQSQARLKLIRKLPPTVFWPPPKVESAVLLVERDPEAQHRIVNRHFFQDFLRETFTQRRKQVAKVLAAMFDPRKNTKSSLPWNSEVWTREQIDLLLPELQIATMARAEEIAVPKWVALANRLQPMVAPALATREIQSAAPCALSEED